MWSSNLTFGYLSEENENINSKKISAPHVHWNIIYNSQDMEATYEATVSGWMDKENVLYVYAMEYYSAKEKNDILPLATTWMDYTGLMLSEISQIEK